MKTKTKNRIKQLYLFILLMMMGMDGNAQESGYLTNRIKPGDILYRDGGGQEHFVDYRQWNRDNPPGTALGVVFFSYYGTVPFGVEGVEPSWHGWVVETGAGVECAWAPVGSVCYDTCMARYPVEGITTPWNPIHEVAAFGIADTCGWQNTKRIVEFIYTGCGAVISESTMPPLYYIYAEKNGITDFSQKPPVRGDSWYLLSYGQLRILYSYLGCVNTALAACGGTLFSEGIWYSSTEVSTRSNACWSFQDTGGSTTAGWFKDRIRNIRAVRSF